MYVCMYVCMKMLCKYLPFIMSYFTYPFSNVYRNNLGSKKYI
jgi:hypothetical protein